MVPEPGVRLPEHLCLDRGLALEEMVVLARRLALVLPHLVGPQASGQEEGRQRSSEVERVAGKLARGEGGEEGPGCDEAAEVAEEDDGTDRRSASSVGGGVCDSPRVDQGAD